MNREQHLRLANDAVTRAERLAGDAENAAKNRNIRDRVEPLAAAGAVWAEVAKAHAVIAAAKPGENPDA